MAGSLKISKYVMIVAWVLTIMGFLAYIGIFQYFHYLGFVTDEDVFESGIAESFWPNICIIWGVISNIVGLPISIISTIVYLVLFYRQRKSTAA